MAKTNYAFEKRQRDLAKKQKQEEKRRQKLVDKAASDGSSLEISEASTNTTLTDPDSAAKIIPDDATAPES